MKIITVEEHFMCKAVNDWYAQVRPGETEMQKAYSKRNAALAAQGVLTDLGEGRFAAMDAGGVAVQVIGYGDNAPMQLRKDEGAVKYCEMANDCLHEGIRANPDRLRGYATLPVDDPDAAVTELTRCVQELDFAGWMINGPFNGEFLDEARFFPIFEKAAELGIPVYLHPGEVKGEIIDRYYTGSWNLAAATAFAGYGIGWHYDTGMHLMRLILSGIFDKLPPLRVIVGHWGELLPYYLERMNGVLRPNVTGLKQDIRHYFWHNVYTNPSGMYDANLFDFCLKTLNPEHILWGQDYPFVANAGNAADFLERHAPDAALREQIAHGNAERLFGLTVSQSRE